METIYHVIKVNSDEKFPLTQALTTVDGLSRWWSKAEKSDEGNLRFHFGGGYSKLFRIIEEGNGRVEWLCIDGAPDWIDTRIVFEISSDENTRTVQFYHSNWKEQTEMYGICNYHWALYMKSLKDLVETGLGNPTKVD